MSLVQNIISLWSELHHSLFGMLVGFWLFIIGILSYRLFPKSAFSMLLEAAFEWIYNFFSSILEWEKNSWIVHYVTLLFFIILVYNLAGLIFDPLASITWFDELLWEFNLSKIITIATWDIHFNAALAVVSIIIMLYAQWDAMNTNGATWIKKSLLKIWKTLYEYIPIFGKNLVSVEQWTMPMYAYAPLRLFIKLFDIVVSLFIWILDIVWLFAKILSLAARLFGNMMAWWILSKLLIVWSWVIVWWVIHTLFKVDANFPVLLPLIVYAQWLLVALIQAFVFPLLVAIFIKVAQGDDEDTNDVQQNVPVGEHTQYA